MRHPGLRREPLIGEQQCLDWSVYCTFHTHMKTTYTIQFFMALSFQHLASLSPVTRPDLNRRSAKKSRRLMLFYSILQILLCIPGTSYGTTISEDALQTAALAHIGQVPEFQVASREAAALGLEVSLRGSTAAAYLYYVKWYLQKMAGDKAIAINRFDFDLMQILKWDRPILIGVRGRKDLADKLYEKICQTFPYLKETPGKLEIVNLDDDPMVRAAFDSITTGEMPLTEAGGIKSSPRSTALLKSVSTNEVFLTRNPLGSVEVESDFVAALHLVHSAAEFQMNLSSSTRLTVQSISAKWQPDPVQATSESVIEIASEIMPHALSFRHAMDLQVNSGVRAALKTMHPKGADGEVDVSGDGWKKLRLLEPSWDFVPILPLNSTEGPTAGELGLKFATHNTPSIPALQSISWSPYGEANMLVSHRRYVGFWVGLGDQEHNGFGTYPVRFSVEPGAGNSDLSLGNDANRNGHPTSIRNAKAVHVANDYPSCCRNLTYYIQYLMGFAGRKKSTGEVYEPADAEILAIRMNQLKNFFGPEDKVAAAYLISKAIRNNTEEGYGVIARWFQLENSFEYPELMDQLRLQHNEELVRSIHFHEKWAKHPSFLKLYAAAVLNTKDRFFGVRIHVDPVVTQVLGLRLGKSWDVYGDEIFSTSSKAVKEKVLAATSESELVSLIAEMRSIVYAYMDRLIANNEIKGLLDFHPYNRSYRIENDPTFRQQYVRLAMRTKEQLSVSDSSHLVDETMKFFPPDTEGLEMLYSISTSKKSANSSYAQNLSVLLQNPEWVHLIQKNNPQFNRDLGQLPAQDICRLIMGSRGQDPILMLKPRKELLDRSGPRCNHLFQNK